MEFSLECGTKSRRGNFTSRGINSQIISFGVRFAHSKQIKPAAAWLLPLGLINSPSLIWTGCFQKTPILPAGSNTLEVVGRSNVLRTFTIVSVSLSS